MHGLELLAARRGGLHRLDLQVTRIEHEFTGPRIDAPQIEGGVAAQDLGREVDVQVEIEAGRDELARVGLAEDVGPIGGTGRHRHTRRRPGPTDRRRRDIGGATAGRACA